MIDTSCVIMKDVKREVHNLVFETLRPSKTRPLPRPKTATEDRPAWECRTIWCKISSHRLLGMPNERTPPHTRYAYHIQGWAKEWSLDCVNSPPATRGSQEVGFTQPREHSFAQPCKDRHILELTFVRLIASSTERS